MMPSDFGSGSPHSPVMIGLANPDPHLLAEPEEGSTQQADRERKQDRGSEDVLQPSPCKLRWQAPTALRGAKFWHAAATAEYRT